MSTNLELEQDEEVFDERMNELLKSAETRLRQGITTQSQTAQLLKKPKLNAGELTRPYITTAGDVSRIDSSILVKKDERALLNEFRKVKVSPSKAEKKKAEVSLFVDLTLHNENRTPPHFFLVLTPTLCYEEAHSTPTGLVILPVRSTVSARRETLIIASEEQCWA